MRTLAVSPSKLAIAAALALTCAAGLVKPAHADRGRSWDGPRHGAFHHYRHDHGRHHRFYHSPRHGRFFGPRLHGPGYNAHWHRAPLFSGSIVFRSAPRVAVPVLPPPRVHVPAPWYGVTELGPVR
jgi:hypothetical protein